MIDPDVQGDSDQSRLSSRPERRVLLVRYGMREVGALRIVSPKYWRDVLRQGFEVREQLSFRELLADPTSAARGPSQPVPIQRLKNFLRECHDNHGQKCNGQALNGHLAPSIPMLQVDVIDRCLVQTTSAGKVLRPQLRLGQGRYVGNITLESPSPAAERWARDRPYPALTEDH